MKMFFGWLYSNGHTLLIASAAFLLGIVVTMPLGWKLSDALASLFGSAAGSIATIGGAILLWKMQQERDAVKASESVYRYVWPVLLEFPALYRAFETERDLTIAKAATQLRIEIDNCIARLTRIKDKLLSLDTSELNMLILVEIRLEELADYCAKVRDIAPNLTPDAVGRRRGWLHHFEQEEAQLTEYMACFVDPIGS